jgi:hypothetical protein
MTIADPLRAYQKVSLQPISPLLGLESLSSRPSRVPAVPPPTRWTRHIGEPEPRRRLGPPRVSADDAERQSVFYASPRSLSINLAAVPRGNRMSGHSSSGSPSPIAG